MFTSQEVGHVILAIFIVGIVASFGGYVSGGFSFEFLLFLLMLLFGAVVVLVNVFTKKIVAYVLDSNVESKIWMWQRYGLYEYSYLKKPMPLGFILPLVIALLSLGQVMFLGILEYDVYASKARASKRIGNVRFSEMTESHIAAIGGLGILANLVLAVVSYVVGWPAMLTKLSILYAFANILPISKLDGMKIFFGSRVGWFILAVLCALGVAFSVAVV